MTKVDFELQICHLISLKIEEKYDFFYVLQDLKGLK